MKRSWYVLVCLTLCLTLLLGACKSKDAQQTQEDVQQTQQAQEDLSFDELIEAAKQEAPLVIYGTHSNVEDAAQLFTDTYGIEVAFTQLGDAELVDKVTAEAKAGTENGADLVYIQDSARVMAELYTPGYVTNYYNDRIAEIVGEDACDPLLVWNYCVKTVVYNSENGDAQMWNNLWAFTDPDNNGLFQMKDPSAEGVNMNFYVMITRDDYAEQLAEAYEDYYGEPIKLDSDCPNAGYQWIKDVYNNGLILGTSDTTICENIGAKGQDKALVGLFTINKYASKEEKDLALAYNEDTEPFFGFYYPIYALMTSNCDSPNAAKAFIEFMYTEEACQFLTRIGDYSANDAINQARDWEEGAWTLEDLANMYVLEDPEWVYANRADVEDFITSVAY